MVAIRNSSFGGIRPKLNARYLGEDGAQIANNVDTTRQGALTPLYGLGGNILGGAFPFDPKTLFRYGIDYLVEDNKKWVACKNDASFARGQITGDDYEVLYFTDNSENPSFPPMFTDKNQVGTYAQTASRTANTVCGITNSFPLGVLAPTVAPTVSSINNSPPEDIETGLTIEYRTYVHTNVYKRSGREMESAPSPASTVVKHYLDSGQVDTVTLLSTGPEEHMQSSEYETRVYRAVAGTFLFAGTTTNSIFADRTAAENLGEPLPSLTWSPPDPKMKGLVNMANGIMAGFNGRDVFFCEPYIPHAWPINYTVTVDSPVVAIVSLDTTLVVLTNERPYFVQGSDPSFMTVVEADIAQACIAPRSATKLGGECYFSSPDGLVTVSPRGSKIITENIFSYRQWNNYFETDSIDGYVHDLKYYGFFKYKNTPALTGTFPPDLNGVFIYDIPTRQFTMSTITATAGFADLRFDKLYLIANDKNVRAWGTGVIEQYTWRSKIFGMPSEVSFSCMQIEAESYKPVDNLSFPNDPYFNNADEEWYVDVDGEAILFEKPDPFYLFYYLFADGLELQRGYVRNRNMIRIKSVLARDWEIQLEGRHEVFNIALAQAGQELASK